MTHTTLFSFPLIAPSVPSISHKQRQLDAIASAYSPPNRSALTSSSTRIDFFHRHAPRLPSPQNTSDTVVTRKTASMGKCQDARLDLSPLSMLFEAIMADVDGDEKGQAGGGIDSESLLYRGSVGTTDNSSVAMSKGPLGEGGVKRGWEGDTFPCSPGHTDTSSVMLSNMPRSLVHDVGRRQAYRSSREVAYSSERINTLHFTKPTIPPVSNRASDHQGFPYASRLSPTTSPMRYSNRFDPITPQSEECLPLLHPSRPVSSISTTPTFPTLLPLTPNSPIMDIGTMLNSTLSSLLAHQSPVSPPPIQPGQDSLLFSSFPTARRASSQPERQTHESGIVDTNHFPFAPAPRDSFGTVWNPSPPPTASAVDRPLKVSPPRPARPIHCRDTLEDFTPFTVSPNAVQSPCLKAIRKSPREYLRLDAKKRQGSVEELQQVTNKEESAEKEKKKFKLAPAPPAIPRKASWRKYAAKTKMLREKGVTVAKSSAALPQVDVEAKGDTGTDEGRWRSSALSVQTFVSALSDLDTVDYNNVPLYTNRPLANEREKQLESKTDWGHEPVQLRDEPMEVLNTIAIPFQSARLRHPPYKQPRHQPSNPTPTQAAKKPSLIRKISASLRMSPRATTRDVQPLLPHPTSTQSFVQQHSTIYDENPTTRIHLPHRGSGCAETVAQTKCEPLEHRHHAYIRKSLFEVETETEQIDHRRVRKRVRWGVQGEEVFGSVVQIGSAEVKREQAAEKEEQEDEELRDILCGGRKIGLALEEVMEKELKKEERFGDGTGMNSGYVASIKGLLGSFTEAIGGWRRSPS
ncbi:hypothetical protein PHBOTO_006375 [Pseudozyma hubeiensis]|nr:hypothetical protein PHBOTO_006375 [Pseudozyma hubeiensis]